MLMMDVLFVSVAMIGRYESQARKWIVQKNGACHEDSVS
eukprot:CAMPEP_0119016396 /NCGR_PEP_ID=MMETSP1176-20130426/12584_1 /TAXON_ID=265551 /ORGANISM="Synedropsis recta cf, Strain CCMP1620" /LENGTH=38 /DNA_ID= /DNA_START= /DNA_END= /DNA_ORIENTATION=